LSPDDIHVELARLEAIPHIEEKCGTIDVRVAIGEREIDDEIWRGRANFLEARCEFVECDRCAIKVETTVEIDRDRRGRRGLRSLA
jgi:hypothetical protein